MKKELMIGCFADDFTGASDAASCISAGGMNTVLFTKIPGKDVVLKNDTDAVVIALKTRTVSKERAVSDSLKALRSLKTLGAVHLFFKFCSTFDSTDEGNIGPVTDASIDYLKQDLTILSPGNIENGRTVRNGVLYVYDKPLSRSSMRNHPLTPMRKSRIKDLMAHQGRYRSIEIHRDALYSERINEKIKRLGTEGKCYIVPDLMDDDDSRRIVELFKDLPFLAGSSGILKDLAVACKAKNTKRKRFSRIKGKTLILSGSCSSMTGRQIEYYKKQGLPYINIEDQLHTDVKEIFDQIKDHDTFLVYSYATPQELSMQEGSETEVKAALIEKKLARIAKLAIDSGYRKIIVSGGETSGAIGKVLKLDSYHIGEIIAPGVPVLIPCDNEKMRIVFKSGNFGDDRFFIKTRDAINDKSDI